jgi:hypothetical protein
MFSPRRRREPNLKKIWKKGRKRNKLSNMYFLLFATQEHQLSSISSSSSTCVAPFHHTTGPSPCSAIEHVIDIDGRKKNSQYSSKSTNYKSGCTHTNGIRRSLGFSLYLYTFCQRGDRKIITDIPSNFFLRPERRD